MVRPERPPLTAAHPRVASKLALLLFGCVLALGLCEALVRVLRLGPETNVVFAENLRLSDDPQLQYELIPGSLDGDTRISSAGLRDKEYARPKPSGVFRILIVGDSIAYGFGLPQSDALSEQLEDLLQSYQSPPLSRFEVLNLGVSGYNIDQVVENVRARAAHWQPDLIVYAYCLNDPQAQSFELESLRALLSPAARSYRDALQRQGQRLLAESRLWLLARFAWQRWREPPPSAAKLSDDQWRALRAGEYSDYFARLYRGAEHTRLQHGVASLAGLARARGVPLVAAVFPVFVDLAQYRLAPLHAAVTAEFRSAGIRSYDLLPVYQTMFRRHGPLFVLNALHPNALGVRLAALYLLRAAIRDHWLPAAAKPWAPHTEMFQLDEVLDAVIAATPTSP
jgi:GDSL-like Lipase/Acylhydrolase family